MKKTASKPGASLAAALLDAHVAYVVDTLCGPGLESLIDSLLEVSLDHARHLTLEQAVTRDTIKATARTWAIELDLRGGIPELVGDTARALHGHPIHDATRLADLLPQDRFRDLLEYALALKSARHRLISGLIASPLYESFASNLLLNGIRDYLDHNPLTRSIPGARSALKLGRAVVNRAAAASGMDGAMEESLRRYIGRSIGKLSAASVQPLIDGEHDAALRDAALDSWGRISNTRLRELLADVSALDVEELFVTLYEWWKELRGTPWLGAMIDGGVDAVFDKYGAASLRELLDDLGITPPLMRAEALRFAPQVLAAMQARGLVEPLVRAGLKGFYDSGRVEQALGLATG